jgi:hypothetical protein
MGTLLQSFRILGLLQNLWMNFQHLDAEAPLAEGSSEFFWVRKLGTNQRCEDVGGGAHIPPPRRNRRGKNSVSGLLSGCVTYLQTRSLRRFAVRHGGICREMKIAEIRCPRCGEGEAEDASMGVKSSTHFGEEPEFFPFSERSVMAPNARPHTPPHLGRLHVV